MALHFKSYKIMYISTELTQSSNFFLNLILGNAGKCTSVLLLGSFHDKSQKNGIFNLTFPEFNEIWFETL